MQDTLVLDNYNYLANIFTLGYDLVYFVTLQLVTLGGTQVDLLGVSRVSVEDEEDLCEGVQNGSEPVGNWEKSTGKKLVMMMIMMMMMRHDGDDGT